MKIVTKTENRFKFPLALLFLALCVLFNGSCKENAVGPNDLSGETKLTLTEVGKVSSTYLSIDNYSLPSGSLTVTKNEGGIVTYAIQVKLKGSSDSAFLAKLIPDDYKDSSGDVYKEFKFKITSEGIQSVYAKGRLWTIMKYSDAEGTIYPFTTDNGTKLERKITEKTGKDDWSFGMMYIKTSKVEQNLPETDKTASKIIFRANHKFGLVYFELVLKNGQRAKMSIIPFFMIQ